MNRTRLMSLVRLVALAAGTATFLPACASDEVPAMTSEPDGGTTGDGATALESGAEADAGLLRARAVLSATSDGGTIQGTVAFVEEMGTTTMTVTITGAPAGLHGLHIHDNASCDPTDAGAALAAGGHWNPDDAGHGYPDADSHHAGDFGNITIGDDGTGTLTYVTTGFYVHPGPDSVVDHAVIFHGGTDDGTTQPSGNSGARAACGIIAQVP
jgi:Cu-Zn family superoxide dismutase